MAERLEAEIVIVGAGPAGLAAACCLGEGGRDVLVVDASARPGGQIWRRRDRADLPAAARPWLDRLAALPIRVLSGATVVDVTPQKLPIRVAGSIGEKWVDKVRDPLNVRCLVLEQGGTRVAIAMVDTCILGRPNLACGAQQHIATIEFSKA